ncbi:MAG TPA: hypothetical protein VEA80_18275 [Vitreimonas sp.]|uniref:hypothetical protein n=1 Tax=Vitreimonas sp. TaxID=3069702 RepID=UPI002D584BAD|nr:hypothetical protein [Vitreimonas sp.]HYD89432.1 hypothetical protein [Vitreimonas sp.]
MFGKSFLRIAAAALALCTLSFAAGIAGDLAEPPRTGVRVVVRIPPELPEDTVRAGPIASVMTPTAAAAVVARPPRQLRPAAPVIHAEEVITPLVKPRTISARADEKQDPDRAPKAAAL